MPYYRITIYLTDQLPKKGIRYFENNNIDAVTNIARVKARNHYGTKVVDIEAAMLSNHCTAVIEYRGKHQRTRENKKYHHGLVLAAYNRKSYTGTSITLQERRDHELNPRIKGESET